jgi:hypothetical protein
VQNLSLEPSTLWKLGYRNFTRAQVSEALHEIYSALEIAVGTRLASQMNKRELEEFDKLMGGPENRAAAWLEDNLPNYRSVVRDELERLERRLEGAMAATRRNPKEPEASTRSTNA